MIDIVIKIESLKSMPLSKRHGLPDASGIYFALSSGKVLYIGQAKNIRRRWQAHHRTADLGDIRKIRIAWVCMNNADERTQLEKQLIRDFKPILNGRNSSRIRSDNLHSERKRQIAWLRRVIKVCQQKVEQAKNVLSGNLDFRYKREQDRRAAKTRAEYSLEVFTTMLIERKTELSKLESD